MFKNLFHKDKKVIEKSYIVDHKKLERVKYDIYIIRTTNLNSVSE